MDRKSKLVLQGGGNKSTNGESRSKEAALGKLHQMEWMRNKQDPWHLARSNSRGQDVQEKKKYNKDEDSYFEGTQKNKKTRRPRQAEGISQSNVPTAFLAGPSAPPPVNAWAQKKGSALFTKPPDEVDDEDEMLKLALKESLKTAEEDKKRHLERVRMWNKPSPAIKAHVSAEKECVSGFNEGGYSTSPPKGSPHHDLHFIDTDSTEETQPSHSQRKRSLPPRASKPTSPHDKCPPFQAVPKPMGKRNESNSFNPSHTNEKLSSSPVGNDSSYDHFKSSSLQEEDSSPPSFNDHETSEQSSTYRKSTLSPASSRKILISKKNDEFVTSVRDVTAKLKSTLTFGDTQDLREKLHDDYGYDSQSNRNDINKYVQMPSDKSSITEQKMYLDSSETDIMLHNFIRHEPPSSVASDADLVKTPETSGLDSLNNPQQYFPLNSPQFEQHHLIRNGNSQTVLVHNNGQDINSSLSDSPLQSVSPYGSFEKQISPTLPGSLHIHSQTAQIALPYPANVQGNQEVTNNLQSIHLASQNLASQIPYPNLPPGYVAQNHAIQNIMAMSAHPQYRHPNPNLMMPPFNSQDLINPSAHMYQHQVRMQQLMAMNALQQYQQAQLAVLNVPEALDSLQKDQALNATQPAQLIQIQNQLLQVQGQPTVGPTQSQPQISMQNHQQMVPPQIESKVIPDQEKMLLNQEVFVNDYQQQINSQNSGEQSVTQSGKSKQEIMFQYQQTLQTLNQLQQELAGSQVQSPPVQIPQPSQPYMYPAAMPINSFYPVMPVMPQQVQQQQAANSGQTSPNNQQGCYAGLPNMDQELMPAQANMDSKIGRGRGRLH